MTPEFERALSQYAELIVKIGLNVQPGQRLLIRAPLEAAPLVRQVTIHAYQAGAHLVDVIWADPQLLRIRFQHAPRNSFAEHSDWGWKAGLETVDAGGAILSINGTDPDLLKGIDPGLIATVQRTESRAALPLSKRISADAINWCVVGYATAAWAAKVFPDMAPGEQLNRLWDAIFSTIRLDTPDPLAAWEAHNEDLTRRAAYLNEKQYDALRYTGPGTDLTVGLPENHHWIGGPAPTAIGISNVANLPTEEVFTAPHRERVDGTVRATMPLNLRGNLIENFSLSFSNGRVTNVSAEKGEALLRSQIEMDDGASRLGEVALVPHSSAISHAGILFYNTLYDENASSHLALGRAYRNCIAGLADAGDETFMAHGGNLSANHLDFMVGSGEIDIDGITADGTREPLMRQGEWVY
ncbi:MAG: aminopeptidase [Candidatus Promineofilum sp.]|uniref:aminopeptidase n=1 Tax=Promineifilum sp. TaxID=2664178 RepID=UPI002412027E|nr:aminopeptidase [Promineifilum sp.]